MVVRRVRARMTEAHPLLRPRDEEEEEKKDEEEEVVVWREAAVHDSGALAVGAGVGGRHLRRGAPLASPLPHSERE